MRLICYLATIMLLLAGLSAAAQAKTVTLSWDASPSSDVAGYKLYAGSDADVSTLIIGSPIDIGNVLTYTLTGVDGEQVQYFAVTAYDADGNESGFSNIVMSGAVDEVAPDVPAGLQQITIKVVVGVSR